MATQPNIPSPVMAMGALVASSLAFGAVGMVIHAQGGRGMVMASPSVVTALAAFCVLFPDTRQFGLLLAWNALGLGLGLLAIGLLSVGALMVLPVVLVIFALATWPRPAGTSIVTLPSQIALVGGVSVVMGLLVFSTLLGRM